MIKQCKFNYKGETLGGIYCDFDNGDNYIICGCCGGVIDPERVEMLTIYDYWIDISAEIIGD